MDPVTLKMVLQLAQVLGKSRMLRSLAVGLVLAGLIGGGFAVFGPMALTAQLAASLATQQQVCSAPPGEPVVSGGGPPKDAGKPGGETAVWQALRAAGFDAVHAAGAMGNMQAESGFDPQIVQGGGHSTRPADAGSLGYGLVQWTPGRKLSDYIGAATPTVANQVETLKAQLAGRGPHPEGAAGAAFWATTDVASAAEAFHLRYERSASKNSTQRIRNAQAIHQRLQGAPVDSSAATITSASTDEAQTGCMPGIRVATWNTYCGASRAIGCSGGHLEVRIARVVAGMRQIAEQADVISTQEMSNARLRKAVLDALPGFGMAGGDTSTPIYYRQAVVTLVSQRSRLVFERGTPMEGPDQGNRWVNTALLRNTTTGKTLTEVNFHQLPKIQKGGRLNRDWPRRIKAARKIFAAAMASAQTSRVQGAVVVTCDCNYEGDPDGMFKAAGLTSASSVFGDLKQATRTRDIDQVLYSAGVPTSMKVLGPFGSDHSARVVTFPGDSPAAAPGPVDGVTPVGFNFPGQRTVEQAIAYMSDGHRVGIGTCLHEVGAAYGHQGTTKVNGHFYATGQWDAMPARYRHTDGSTPPRGALVFWTTSNVAGHIAISAGGGYVWTTDPNGGPGTIAKVPISMPDGWGVRLGWAPPVFVGKTNIGSDRQ